MPWLTHWLAARATWLCDASISYIISGTHWSSCKWGLIGTCGWWKYMDLIPYKWYNHNPMFLMMNLIQYNSLVLFYIIHQADVVALRWFTVESTEICGYVWYMQRPHLRTTYVYIYIYIYILFYIYIYYTYEIDKIDINIYILRGRSIVCFVDSFGPRTSYRTRQGCLKRNLKNHQKNVVYHLKHS